MPNENPDFLKIAAVGAIVHDQDTTSQATNEWTVPTNKLWWVVAIIVENNNRATTSTIYLDIGASNYNLVVGGVMDDNALKNYPNGIIAKNGQKIGVTDVAFVAADVVKKTILYYEVTW